MNKRTSLNIVAAVLSSFHKDGNVKSLCEKYGISKTTFYRYKLRVLEGVAKVANLPL